MIWMSFPRKKVYGCDSLVLHMGHWFLQFSLLQAFFMKFSYSSAQDLGRLADIMR